MPPWRMAFFRVVPFWERTDCCATQQKALGLREIGVYTAFLRSYQSLSHEGRTNTIEIVTIAVIYGVITTIFIDIFTI